MPPKVVAIRDALLRSAPERSASERFVLTSLASERSAKPKFAPERFAPDSFVPRKFAPPRSNPYKFASDRSAPKRTAVESFFPKKSAFFRSGSNSGFSFLHLFQTSTLYSIIFRCSSFATYTPLKNALSLLSLPQCQLTDRCRGLTRLQPPCRFNGLP